ncbi:TspO/MBR family protein [Halorussus halophilus]|uniref:TspO/MBR family protein n=1 Tax=Halorussus halophilus TaxID=2650975 RepID=UPI0013010882|nr:TspO/MBR family protein [Halorussus halophilus]
MNVFDRIRRRSGTEGDAERGVSWPALLASIVVCQLAGIVPSILTADDVATWYPTLVKPAFNPPNWVFGPVWTTLYLLMGIALYLVWRSDAGRIRQLALAVFAVQLALNASWTLVFFGANLLFGGLVVIVVLLATIVATIVAFARIDRRAAALLVPYLLWVSFATVLNYELWRLNA